MEKRIANMRFDKYHWTNLNESTKKEYTFKKLNVEGLENNSDIKLNLIGRSLYGYIMNKNRLVNEVRRISRDQGSENGNGTNQDAWDQFSKTSSWVNFKKQARMLSSFLSANKDEIEKALEKMETIFKGLGQTQPNEQGEDPVEIGFNMIGKVRESLLKAKIDTVSPPINEDNILQLIQNNWKDIDDTSLFLNMIITRKNRKFSNLIGENKYTTLGQALQLAFGSVAKKNQEKMEKMLQIFTEIVKRDEYTKGIGKNNVGKAEIALAMFFGDCFLPDSGDIQMGDKLIEIKGDGGTIALRTGQSDWLSNGVTKQTRWSTYPNRVKNSNELLSLIRELNIDDFSPAGLNNAVNIIDKARNKKNDTTKRQKLDSLKFAFVFGVMFNSYVRDERIKCFWLFNTEKNKKTGELSKLLTTPIIQIDTNPKNNMWANAFKFLNNPYIDLVYKSRDNQSGYTFSIDFTSGAK